MQDVILPEKQRSPWERATTATAMTAIMTRTMMTMAMMGPDPASTKKFIYKDSSTKKLNHAVQKITSERIQNLNNKISFYF